MPESASILILSLRGLPVLIDADLVRLYGVPTKRVNEPVRRNQARFPADFLFELTPQEKAEVVANCDHLQNLKFSKAWIEKRLRGIAVRDELADEWKKLGTKVSTKANFKGLPEVKTRALRKGKNLVTAQEDIPKRAPGKEISP
jgi:hypothetical protein